MKKLISLMVIVLVLGLASTAALAGTYLYGFTPGGALGGGVRYDLASGVLTDLSLTAGSGDTGYTYTLYGDVFWGNWGIGVDAKKATVNAELAFDINIQYAVEQAITDDIAVGIGITLINYDTTSGIDPNLTVMPAVAPYFVLTL